MIINWTLKAAVSVLSCFVIAKGIAQPSLEKRMQAYALLPNQSFIEDTGRQRLSLVNLVNPEQLRDTDSFKSEAALYAVKVRKEVVARDWGTIRQIDVIYVNRYCYDLDQAFLFRFHIKEYTPTNIVAPDSLPGLTGLVEMSVPEDGDSLVNGSLYRRECGYPLAENEFLMRVDSPSGFGLELFKNVTIGPLMNKVDSLEGACRQIARRFFVDIVREDCADCIGVSVSYQDQHLCKRSIGWSYKVGGCWLDEAGVRVGR